MPIVINPTLRGTSMEVVLNKEVSYFNLDGRQVVVPSNSIIRIDYLNDGEIVALFENGDSFFVFEGEFTVAQ